MFSEKYLWSIKVIKQHSHNLLGLWILETGDLLTQTQVVFFQLVLKNFWMLKKSINLPFDVSKKSEVDKTVQFHSYSCNGHYLNINVLKSKSGKKKNVSYPMYFYWKFHVFDFKVAASNV